MKLYYMAGACSLATHIVLEWVGAAYETQQLSHDELKQDAFLEVNPLGAVPTLDVDGWILTQNAAILNYLAEQHPEAGLTGDGSLKSRTEINRWFGLINSDLHPKFKPFFGATSYLEDDAAIEKTKTNATQAVQAILQQIDTQLADKDWVTGSRSIVDPYLFVLTNWTKMLKLDLGRLDNVDRFFKHMNGDAGVQKALKDEGLT